MSEPTHHASRPRLAAIAIAIGVAIVSLTYWRPNWEQPVVVEAIFEIGRPSGITLASLPPFEQRKYKKLGRVSHGNSRMMWDLPAIEVCNDPKIASLPILKGKTDPWKWITKQMVMSLFERNFRDPGAGVVWSVQLRGSESEAEQLKLILEHMFAAEEKHDFWKRQGRLVAHDAVKRIESDVADEIARKEESLLRLKANDATAFKAARAEVDSLADLLKDIKQKCEVLDIETQLINNRRIIQPPTIHAN